MVSSLYLALLNRLIDAYLFFEKNQAGEGEVGAVLILMLENAKYVINFNPDDSSKTWVKGPELQNLCCRYDKANEEILSKSGFDWECYRLAYEAKDSVKIREYETKRALLEQEMRKCEDRFIRTNFNSPFAAFLLSRTSYKATNLKEMYEKLGDDAKNTGWGEMIRERLKKITAIEVGNVAPNFTQSMPDGKPLSLYSLKGRVKILDFWSSGCRPCRAENPNLVKLYKEYHSKGLEILSISLDSQKEDWVNAIAADNMIWYHVSDLKGYRNAVAQLYDVYAIPTLIVLDENNVIMASGLRGDALGEKLLKC